MNRREPIFPRPPIAENRASLPSMHSPDYAPPLGRNQLSEPFLKDPRSDVNGSFRSVVNPKNDSSGRELFKPARPPDSGAFTSRQRRF
jgi:hypothetical protein